MISFERIMISFERIMISFERIMISFKRIIISFILNLLLKHAPPLIPNPCQWNCANIPKIAQSSWHGESPHMNLFLPEM